MKCLIKLDDNNVVTQVDMSVAIGGDFTASDGWLIVGGPVFAGQTLVNGEFINPSLSIDKIKENAIVKIKAFATSTRAKLARNADFYTVGGWPYKRERALRFRDGKATPEDEAILQSEIDRRARGEALDELVAKQLLRADFFERASVIVDGLESAGIKAVNDALDVDAVDLVIVSLRENATIELEVLLGKLNEGVEVSS